MKTCNFIKSGLLETPCKVKPHATLKAYIEKIVKDPVFHATLPSVLNHVTSRKTEEGTTEQTHKKELLGG